MNLDVTWKQLYYFKTLSEQGKYIVAAQILNISQPALSKQIAELEEKLGVLLVHRNNRNVEITDAGKVLYSESLELFKQLDITIKKTQQTATGFMGGLKISYLGSAMHQWLPKQIPFFLKSFPEIKIQFLELENTEQIRRIKNFDLDIGIVRWDKFPDYISSKTILEENFVLVLPKDHPVNKLSPSSIEILKNDSFILFDPLYSPSYYDQFMRIFKEMGISPQVNHTGIHAYTVFRLIENNMGVAIVPKSVCDGYDMGIKFIELDNIQEKAQLKMIWRKDTKNPIVYHFTQSVKRHKNEGLKKR